MVICELTCGHRVAVETQYVNLNQAEERCPVHGASMLVVDTRRDCWHTRCKSCRFGRSHGMSRAYAEQAAARHYATTGHEVSLLFYNEWSSSRLLVESPTAATQSVLPGFGDLTDAEPPY